MTFKTESQEAVPVNLTYVQTVAAKLDKYDRKQNRSIRDYGFDSPAEFVEQQLFGGESSSLVAVNGEMIMLAIGRTISKHLMEEGGVLTSAHTEEGGGTIATLTVLDHRTDHEHVLYESPPFDDLADSLDGWKGLNEWLYEQLTETLEASETYRRRVRQ